MYNRSNSEAHFSLIVSLEARLLNGGERGKSEACVCRSIFPLSSRRE